MLRCYAEDIAAVDTDGLSEGLAHRMARFVFGAQPCGQRGASPYSRLDEAPCPDMNLILWRHAEAEDLPDALSISRSADLQRPLTRRGRKQADASAAWLRAHLAADYRVVCSPAVRTRETAAALCGAPEILDALAPGADVGAVLAAIDWPQGHEHTVVVGHQPWIGQLASLLLAGQELNWSVKKSGIWWLTARTRESEAQVVLRAVIQPDFL